MQNNKYLKSGSPVRFVVVFVGLFLLLNYFNIFYFGLTAPGGAYNSFLDTYLNYIDWLRWVLLHTSADILNLFGFNAIVSKYELLVAGHGMIKLVYTCLGLGVMSFITAFIVAYPKPLKSKINFLFVLIFGMQILNILRFILLALYWDRSKARIVDHHLIFDVIIYIIIAIAIYYWVNGKAKNQHAAN